MIAWEHDADGEAEFWPSGNCPALAVLFEGRNNVTGAELRRVLELLDAVAGDDEETLLRLHLLVNVQGGDLDAITAAAIGDLNVHIYRGDCLHELQKEAAIELFAVWDRTPLEGLWFEKDDFLESSLWITEAVDLGGAWVVLVMPS